MIWLIAIQNGTIPTDDLDFIQSLNFNKPILVVLNKADQKSDDEIEMVLQTTLRDIARKGGALKQQIVGVTAYSAADGEEYGDNRCLEQFLQQASQYKPGNTLWQKAEQIFSNYHDFYESERIQLRQLRGVLNEAAIELTDERLALAESQAQGARRRIQILKENSKDLNEIQQQVLDLIESIAEKIGITLANEQIPNMPPSEEIADEFNRSEWRFQGITSVIPEQLSHDVRAQPTLTNLHSVIRKVDSFACYIDIDGDFEAMVSLDEITKKTGWNREMILQELLPGQSVGLHLLEQGRCTIILPFHP